MNKTLKIVSILLVIVMIVMTAAPVFAAGDLITDLEETGKGVDTENTGNLITAAGNVMRVIRTIAVIGGVILIMFLGVKFMMGSAEEKAEYKKSFMPLIIGIIVVMSASQIATMLFGIMGA